MADAISASQPPPRILVVMIDGLGDRAWLELDGRTPLQAARTPNLDALARASATGILHSLGPGRAPGTELAHFVLLGFPAEEYPGRVVFEAAGCGFELSPADVAFRALFSKVRRVGDGSLLLVEHFAEVDDRFCRAIAQELGSLKHGGLTVSFEYTGARQGVLTVAGGASEDVTDCDPFFTGRSLAAVRPLDDACDPVAARMTAEAVTAFLENAYEVFRANGPSTGNESLFLVIKWVGRKRALPTFAQRTGMDGVIVGSGTLLTGIAAELGMGFRAVPMLADARTDVEQRLTEARLAFDEGADFVLAHTKVADEAGHAKDPSLKRDVIAGIDRGLASLVDHAALAADTIICVTADHGTPSGTGLIHSGDPVPVILSGPGIGADAVEHFDERACAGGSLGHLRGEDFMPVLLNARGTTRYLGARLSAYVGLHWPEEYETFRVR
ncbi:MAG: 2,3-bisphosphoglycerate-independent phosphoglycerate mutase [Coriobacteriia bacterium]|nr:2,3-bisphosphoglycerate-independent phosphoglycerate mutase [Coriobacteriia bacterium]